MVLAELGRSRVADLDKTMETINAVVKSHGTIAGGYECPRAYDLYGVERGDNKALYRAICELGDPATRIRELCAAAGLPHLPSTLSGLLEALDKRKVVFKRTVGGSPNKWDRLGPDLLARVEAVKDAASDEDALRKIFTANPKLLKTFCREKTWRALLNSKERLKPGANITPVINTLKNELSKARRNAR
jgi:hypothetical protein